MKGKDQQPEATLNASCKPFHCSHTVYVGLPSSLLPAAVTIKTAASPDVVQLTGTSTTPTQRSFLRGDWTGCGSTRSPP